MKISLPCLLAALPLALAFAAVGCRGEVAGQPWLASEVPPDASAQELALHCTDGEDNDLDGLTDCGDPDCRAATACAELGEEPVPGDRARCWDGIDNDQNGFTDCADYGCSKETEQRYCCPESPEDDKAEDSVETCADGIDNDCNGYIDCGHYSCRDANVPYCETSEATCSDGVDNDQNGFTDCSDFSCGDTEVCQ